MSGALRHFLESEDAVNSSGGETVARAAAGRGSTAGAVAARAAARLLSVFRCFGVSTFAARASIEVIDAFARLEVDALKPQRLAKHPRTSRRLRTACG
ncbi:hypothetical protein [Burkholderia savannae]|uniref:hypothetical protein n=1 Tax=Burkholderia savannae TaxID=1637837 RepID=UPI000A54764C|nr:hypothetical protein [Burkholderia savannae]